MDSPDDAVRALGPPWAIDAADITPQTPIRVRTGAHTLSSSRNGGGLYTIVLDDAGGSPRRTVVTSDPKFAREALLEMSRLALEREAARGGSPG